MANQWLYFSWGNKPGVVLVLFAAVVRQLARRTRKHFRRPHPAHVTRRVSLQCLLFFLLLLLLLPQLLRDTALFLVARPATKPLVPKTKAAEN
jgi:hypothetical protein